MSALEHPILFIDKHVKVPKGARVYVEYVPIDRIRLGSKKPVAIGDVNDKYQLILQNRPACIFPCPVGFWDGAQEDAASRFVIQDGRHSYIAYLMHGYESILVAWIESP